MVTFFIVLYYIRIIISVMNWDNATIMGTFYWLYCIVAILLMVKVMLKNRDTVKTLAWMMVLIFLPVLGLVLYFFFGRDTRRVKLIGHRQLSQLKQRDHLYISDGDVCEIPQDYASLVSFFRNSAMAHPFAAEEVEVITETTVFTFRLINELKKAKEHIHMQFYIFEDDELGREIASLLVEKARQGVEVRLIYDSVGCWSVRKDFFEQMRCAGVYVESFLKVRFPLFTNKVNYRNHRKVVVIDGNVGFIGGSNIADRYIKGVEWGVWRDTMLLIRGVAVHGLQASFLVDWYFTNRSLVSGKRYFPLTDKSCGAVIQVVPSNPIGEIRTIMGGLVKLLSLAKNYVYLQTPYFMPDETFLMALRNAAVSGVDVRLMIPMRSDSSVADHISMSYLGNLLQCGVKVFLYTGGLLHSKAIVCDDYISSVGSANLDFRSFYYNFEISAFVYDREVAQELKQHFIDDVAVCHQLTLNEYRSRSFLHRCFESVARLFSPLL